MVVTKELREKLDKSQKVFLIVPQEAGLDGLCGALALKHTFSNNNRKVEVVFDGAIPEQTGDLPEADQILTNLGNKDLVLKFKVGSQGIEKISYSMEGEILSLRVRPKSSNFDVENFHYVYEGARANLIVTFGISKLDKLSFYNDYKDSFEKSEIINLGEPLPKEQEKKEEVKSEEIPEAKSISQFIFEQLIGWGITPNREASICLLKGISL